MTLPKTATGKIQRFMLRAERGRNSRALQSRVFRVRPVTPACAVLLDCNLDSPPLQKGETFVRLTGAVGGDVMRKAILGRTGLEISELVLGGGVTGGILINADEATRFAALRRAVMGGINWIDTAPIYGNGASEETIGRHIESLTPRPQISTKVRLEAEDMDEHSGRDPAQPGGEPDALAAAARSSCSSCTIISARRLAAARR